MGNEEALDRIELFRDELGEWRFRAVAWNGEIVASSEGYKNHLDAKGEAQKLWPDVEVKDAIDLD